jgi:predicted porin
MYVHPKFIIATLGLVAMGSSAHADNLYYVGEEAQEGTPLKWVAGLNGIWDDNPAPTATGPGSGGSSFALNPFLGASTVINSPQTTIDLYGRLGVTYYTDAPEALGDDTFYQSRAGLNVTHRVSERLRLSSRNFVAYELEPDYSYGFATGRQNGEYLYYSSDQSVGYRWTERLGTYTGIRFTGLDYDAQNNDRATWEIYQSFRYQVSPQTVGIAEYRYASTSGDGLASDSTAHFLLLGAEHRLSANTVAIVRAGAQLRDSDDGGSSSSPYLEGALQSRINSQVFVRSFIRYGIEDYDTVQYVPNAVEFDDHRVVRIGVSADYSLSQFVTLFSGVDYIHSNFQDGRDAVTSAPVGLEPTEDLVNLYVGFAYKVTPVFSLNGSYNYTDSTSDIDSRNYDRNRVSLGVSAEF